MDVELLLGQPAQALDGPGRAMLVGERAVPFGSLVIATGSAPRTLPEYEGRPGVVTLRTLDDARLLRERLPAAALDLFATRGSVRTPPCLLPTPQLALPGLSPGRDRPQGSAH